MGAEGALVIPHLSAIAMVAGQMILFEQDLRHHKRLHQHLQSFRWQVF
jgi:hypothetical protein